VRRFAKKIAHHASFLTTFFHKLKGEPQKKSDNVEEIKEVEEPDQLINQIRESQRELLLLQKQLLATTQVNISFVSFLLFPFCSSLT
jgi:hypothetical protein